jgi:hypothetical protein
LDELTFWSLIEQIRHEALDDGDKQVELLFQALVQLTKDEILAFYRIMNQQMNLSKTAELWNAASIITCGCSDDGFLDFRAWLIGQGKNMFEMVLKDPESLVDIVKYPKSTRNGDIYYAIMRAYSYKTSETRPPLSKISVPLMHKEKLTDNDNILKKEFPKLYEKFGDCKELLDDLALSDENGISQRNAE